MTKKKPTYEQALGLERGQATARANRRRAAASTEQTMTDAQREQWEADRKAAVAQYRAKKERPVATFTKVRRGWYATEDGRWAVVVDGYEASQSAGREASTGYEGFQGGEWALVHDPNGNLRVAHNDGENVDWFPTKREAVEAGERRIAKEQKS